MMGTMLEPLNSDIEDPFLAGVVTESVGAGRGDIFAADVISVESVSSRDSRGEGGSPVQSDIDDIQVMPDVLTNDYHDRSDSGEVGLSDSSDVRVSTHGTQTIDCPSLHESRCTQHIVSGDNQVDCNNCGRVIPPGSAFFRTHDSNCKSVQSVPISEPALVVPDCFPLSDSGYGPICNDERDTDVDINNILEWSYEELRQSDHADVDSVTTEDMEPVEEDRVVPLVNLSTLMPGELMIVPVTYGDTTVDALVDTGASVSFIRESVVKQMGLPVDWSQTRSLKGIGSCIVHAVGVTEIALTLYEFPMGSFQFVVLPDSAAHHAIILGTDFLVANELIVNIGRKSIARTEADGSVWQLYVFVDHRSPQVVYRSVPIFAAQTVHLPGDVSFVPVQTKTPILTQSCSSPRGQQMELYYDGLVDAELSVKFAGVEGLLEWGSSGSEVLLVPKPAGTAVEICKGDLLGHLYTIVDIEEPMIDEPDGTDAGFKEWTRDRMNDEIITGSDLTEEQRSSVLEMLLSKSGALSGGESDVGKAVVPEHHIELYDDTPIRQRPRRFPEPVVEEIERQCRELEEIDVIERSQSPWSSPIVPVRKKAGGLRICIDYRMLNKVTKPNRFPMPNLGELIFSLHGTQYFTSLDLIRGYYQIPLEKDSREVTAFSTSRNHYQFKRLPFGLRNAPAVFQANMQDILGKFNRKNVLIYIDDVLIMEKSFDQHLALVEEVLDTFQNHGIKIKPSKCSWFQSEVPFLGHVVGRSGMKKNPTYTKEVVDFPKPKTVEDLRRFLGLLNFQRKFIPNCSSIAKPLSQHVGGPKRKLLLWTTEMETAFGDLREAMRADLELAFPDYSPDAEKLELSVDASGTGAGGCLSQMQNGHMRAIAYASISFSGAQLSYSTTDKELAAIRWAVKAFRPFVFGVPFLLFTDHRPLVYMNNMSRDNTRILRTLNELADYDFVIHYRPGKDNVAADALSRMHGSGLEVAHSIDPEYLPDNLERVTAVPGGGDSLFLSLLVLLRLHHRVDCPVSQIPTSAEELRVQLVEEVLCHSEKYGLKLDKAMRGQIKQMRYPGCLPSVTVLLAFSALYGVLVVVHHGMRHPVLYNHSVEAVESPPERFHLQCLAGIHYNPVRELPGYHPSENGTMPLVPIESDLGRGEDECVSDDSNLEHSECEVACCTHVGDVPVGTSVVIGQRTFCSFADTGAQVSLITMNVWEQLTPEQKQRAGLNTANKPVLGGLGGAMLRVHGIVVLPIRILGVDQEVSCPFALVGNDVIPCCVLLGINALIELRAEMNFHTSQFSVCLSGERYFLPMLVNFASTALPGNSSACVGYDIMLFPRKSDRLASLDDINEIQESNVTMIKLRDLILANVPSTQWTNNCVQRFKRYQSRLRVCLGILMYDRDGESVPVVPFLVMVEFVLRTHWSMAHIGRCKVIHLVSQHCWHPSLDEVARGVTSCCPKCQLSKIAHQTAKPPVLKIEVTIPFDTVNVDLISLPKTQRGHVACMVVVDYCSKWLVVVPLRDKRSETVAVAFEGSVLATLPRRIRRVIMDNGKEFVGEPFSGMLSRYGVVQTFSTPYSPTSCGAVERSNRTLTELLRSLVNSPDNWDKMVTKAVIVYNHTVHAAIGMSPSDYVLKQVHDVTTEPVLESTIKKVWSDGHPKFESFTVGQHVVKRVVTRGRMLVDKLSPKYDGPFVITRVNENGVTYVLDKLFEHTGAPVRAHHRQLKPWKTAPTYITSHPVYHGLLSQLESDTEPVPVSRMALRFDAVHSETTADSEGDIETAINCKINFPSVPMREGCRNEDSVRGGSLDTVPSVEPSAYEVDNGIKLIRLKALRELPCSEMCEPLAGEIVGSDVMTSTPDPGKRKGHLPSMIAECSSVISLVQNESQGLVDSLVALLDCCEDTLDGVVSSLQLDLLFVEQDDFDRYLTPELRDVGVGQVPIAGDSTNRAEHEVDTQPEPDFEGFDSRVADLVTSTHAGDMGGFRPVASATTHEGPSDANLRSPRPSLSPIKQCIRAGRAHIDQSRQRARERLERLREILTCIHSTASVSGVSTCSTPVAAARPYTRAMGIVPEFPNVQETVLEYRR